MFEKFLSSNHRDFKQRYEGTFGFYKDDKGGKMLAQLTNISDRTCHFMDARGLEYKLNADAQTDIGFEFLPPKAGYFNTDMGAMLVQRVPARQFQRGVSSRNVTVHCLFKGGALMQQKINFALLERLYEKALKNKEAQSFFESGKLSSWALTPQVCLGDSGHVWVFSEVVGTFTREGTHYKVKMNENSIFRTELTDAFKAVGTTAEVN